MKALSNFKAAIETNLEKIDDKTARRFKTAVEKTVNSGLPQSFTLKMPIIKGEQEIEFAVDVILEAGDGRVSIFLDSIEAEEFADEIKNTAIEKQLEYLQEHYVVLRNNVLRHSFQAGAGVPAPAFLIILQSFSGFNTLGIVF